MIDNDCELHAVDIYALNIAYISQYVSEVEII